MLRCILDRLIKRELSHEEDLEVAERLVMKMLDIFPYKKMPTLFSTLGQILRILIKRTFIFEGDLQTAERLIAISKIDKDDYKILGDKVLEFLTKRNLSNPGDLQIAKKIVFQMKNRSIFNGGMIVNYSYKDDGLVSILNVLIGRKLSYEGDLNEANKIIEAISDPKIQEEQRRRLLV